MAIYTGCVVKVIAPNHPMQGWVGQVTSPRMWERPIYKKIPEGKYRIEFDSGEGRFYGDYATDELLLIKEPGKPRIEGR